MIHNRQMLKQKRKQQLQQQQIVRTEFQFKQHTS